MRYIFLRFPEGKQKALTLSYDDGAKADKKLIEIADKYNIKVTLNINSCNLNETENHVSIDDLKGFLANGHEIATHGEQHIAPGGTTITNGINDTLECRKALERTFNTIIRGMAYPDTGISVIHTGTDKNEIKRYLKDLGIAYSRTLGDDNNSFDLPLDFYEWMPTAHHTNPHLFEWLDEFLAFKRPGYIAKCGAPKLFYLWGHSYEFNNDNSWDRLEEFCKRAGNNEEIWYATNIEIHDYIEAYKSLKFNVDGTRVYNPSCQKVWFEVDAKIYCVNPGESKLFIED